MASPYQAARGDERGMAIHRHLGIVEHLNFKVGHAAMVLIHRKTGSLAYFDFGRYITPRGYGRARSVDSDPRLALETRAQINNKGEIGHLHAVLGELHQLIYAMHGGGRMFFPVARL